MQTDFKKKFQKYVMKNYYLKQNQIGGRFDEWKIDFVDGVGKHHTHLYDILCNLSLIMHKKRPTFLIQPVDYSDNDRKNVMTRIKTNIESNITEFGYPVFEEIEIEQGILIRTSEIVAGSEYYNTLTQQINNFLNDQDNDNLLGDILGYPCAGDAQFPIDPSRKILHLTIDNSGIMSNVCNATRIEEAHKKFVELKNFLDDIKKSHDSWKDLPEINVS